MYNARSQNPITESVINSVYVRFVTSKLHEYITEEDFHKVFDKFGCVQDVSIKESSVDKRLGRQSGYGFVHFSCDSEGIECAIRAVSEVDNSTFDGVTYNVELSKNLLKQFNDLQKVQLSNKDKELHVPMTMASLEDHMSNNFNMTSKFPSSFPKDPLTHIPSSLRRPAAAAVATDYSSHLYGSYPDSDDDDLHRHMSNLSLTSHPIPSNIPYKPNNNNNNFPHYNQQLQQQQQQQFVGYRKDLSANAPASYRTPFYQKPPQQFQRGGGGYQGKRLLPPNYSDNFPAAPSSDNYYQHHQQLQQGTHSWQPPSAMQGYPRPQEDYRQPYNRYEDSHLGMRSNSDYYSDHIPTDNIFRQQHQQQRSFPDHDITINNINNNHRPFSSQYQQPPMASSFPTNTNANAGRSMLSNSSNINNVNNLPNDFQSNNRSNNIIISSNNISNDFQLDHSGSDLGLLSDSGRMTSRNLFRSEGATVDNSILIDSLRGNDFPAVSDFDSELQLFPSAASLYGDLGGTSSMLRQQAADMNYAM